MTAHNYTASVYLPTNGVFLTTTWARFHDLKQGVLKTITNSEVMAAYAEWHESAHIVQLLTSPYVFQEQLRLVNLLLDSSNLSKLDATYDEQLRELRAGYAAFRSELTTPKYGVSPSDLIETHALCQGLRWTTPDNSCEEHWVLAQRLYDSS